MLKRLLGIVAMVIVGSGGLLAAPPLIEVASAATPAPEATPQGWIGTVESVYIFESITSHSTLNHLQKATHVTGAPGSMEFTWEYLRTDDCGSLGGRSSDSWSAAGVVSSSVVVYLEQTGTGQDWMSVTATASGDPVTASQVVTTCYGDVLTGAPNFYPYPSPFVPGCSTDGYSGHHFRVPANVQAVVTKTRCEQDVPQEDGVQTIIQVQDIRLIRSDCDEAVDSDAGGVSDCEEYALRTDPLNPTDDTDDDADGDGVKDADDRCPTDAGPAALAGCPDGDGDSVPDIDDRCPTEPGLAALDGCLDIDGDAIADIDDRCPTDAGPAALAGCPDGDGDSVPDIDDQCPTEPGDSIFQGCPDQCIADKAAIVALEYEILNAQRVVDIKETQLKGPPKPSKVQRDMLRTEIRGLRDYLRTFEEYLRSAERGLKECTKLNY